MTVDLLSIFGAGILTFLTPCVLPIIPIYLAVLTGGDMAGPGAGKRGKIALRAAVFSSGFILVFTLLGLGASSVGAFLIDHRAILQAVGAVLVLLFGLKFLGVIRVPFLDRIVKLDDQKMQTRFGLVNAFVMGVGFATGWSPCVGPILGAVLTYTAASTSDPLTGVGYLGAYGLGFAVPLMVTALFAEVALKWIGRLSAHLPRIEKAVGILLLVVAGSMLFDASHEMLHASSSPEDGVAYVDPNADGLPVMYKFYADDCTVCHRVEPVVESIVAQCDQKGVRVISVNISEPENKHWISRYRLVGVPTFVFVDEAGHETARLLGEQTEQSLKQSLSALRGTPCPGIELIEQSQQQEWSADAKANCAI